MNLRFYIEKLRSSEEFQKFEKENPQAFFCSGFLSIDKEGNDNKTHLDYFSPQSKKGFSFQIEDGIKLIELESFDEKIPRKISEDIDLELNEIESLILEKMKEENINNKIQKIVLSLQRFDDEDFLTGTIFISMLGMIRIKISLIGKKITDFEKKSLLDIMNIFKKNDN